MECVERGLDPLTAHLVVADASRTDKTICLAVSPALKAIGLGGRPRLFEVEQRVRRHNAEHPAMAVTPVVAPPRMALYLDYSSRIFQVYLRFVAPEDIHAYSVDEVLIDATAYLATYRLTPRRLAMKMIRAVLAETGITATAGIGTNLYLCKVAMDIVAKKMPPDADGVRIAELTEESYRRQLWSHMPLTDFWRIGPGTERKLAAYGLLTMGDVARCSIEHEDMLYRLFGVNAELLIDHAWGWEPVTMAHIKAHCPESHSLSSGQVLPTPYSAARARVVVMEMVDALALDLVEQHWFTDHMVLEVGYDAECAATPSLRAECGGRFITDHYGRTVPAPAHGTARTAYPTSSCRLLSEAVAQLFDRIVNPRLTVRRLTLAAESLEPDRGRGPADMLPEPQPDLFTDPDELRRSRQAEIERLEAERRRQLAVLQIKKQFGRNAILRGINYADGATQRQRNSQIGGHKA